MTIHVRSIEAGDRAAWDGLWAGYLAFYETELDPAATEETWRRLVDPTGPIHGQVAVDANGDLVGLVHHLFHPSTWSTTSVCYLEDLYVDPNARRDGVGRALIEAVADAARSAGSDQVYWHTQATNARARTLYDQVARHDGFVVYELPLSGTAAD